MKVAYLVGKNDAGTWGIEELWIINGNYRGPFRTKKVAIEREEAIGAESGLDLVRVERADGREELIGTTSQTAPEVPPVTLDRERLETLQDRPSLHSNNPTDRTLGRFQAVVDQHLQDAHPGVGSVMLHQFCCGICGFNAHLEFLRLYPEKRLGLPD